MNVYFTTNGEFRQAWIDYEHGSHLIKKDDILHTLSTANIIPDDNRVLWTFTK